MRVLFVPHSLDGTVGGNEREVGGGGEGGGGCERNLWGNRHISALLSQPKIHMYHCRSSQLPPPPKSFPQKEILPQA